jgi:hypothetical protein
MRTLAKNRLRLVTKLAMRHNNKSRFVHEFVRAAARKLNSVGQTVQENLPLEAVKKLPEMHAFSGTGTTWSR